MRPSLFAAAAAVRVAAIVVLSAAATRAAPYEPTWPSVTKHGGAAWFSDAKFGIYSHWGPYSVPAFGSEWYSRNMYVLGSREHAHHLATYGARGAGELLLRGAAQRARSTRRAAEARGECVDVGQCDAVRGAVRMVAETHAGTRTAPPHRPS